MSRRTYLAVGALAGVLLIGAGAYLAGYGVASRQYAVLYAQFSPIRQPDPTDPLIAPILGFHAPEATDLGHYQSLKNSLQTEITKAVKSGGASRVSVYFRDLDTLQWVGINQLDTYYPASLLKVPVMFAYYKEAETNPSLLSDEVVYRDVSDPDPFAATSTLEIGKSYSIDELIDHMITDSDNGATFTLLSQIDPTVLDQVYTDLGIPDPGDDSASYQISTRTYALFFRILYNATYLSPAYSEKALELLSKATFADGLVAGVSRGTQVAHKFGEHVVSSDGKTVEGVELHDCGVVYYPAHPYLLCVMTSAKDLPTATGIIKTISATTYGAVAQEYAATSTAK